MTLPLLALREGVAFLTYVYIPMSKIPMMEELNIIKYQLDDSANGLSLYLTSDPMIFNISMIPQILFFDPDINRNTSPSICWFNGNLLFSCFQHTLKTHAHFHITLKPF